MIPTRLDRLAARNAEDFALRIICLRMGLDPDSVDREALLAAMTPEARRLHEECCRAAVLKAGRNVNPRPQYRGGRGKRKSLSYFGKAPRAREA